MNKGLFLLIPACLAAGCSTVINNHGQKADMMSAYVAGDTATVSSELEGKLKPPSAFNTSVVGSGDEICWRVESGAHKFLSGDMAGSIADFDAAKDRIEEADDRALVSLRDTSSEAAGLLTNPCALPYRAFGRDRVMIPVFKAFDYLAQGDEQGFHVELNAIRSVQQDIIDRNAKYFAAETEATEKAKSDNAKAAESCNPDTVLENQNNAALSTQITQARQVAHRGYADMLNPLASFLSGWGYLLQSDAQNACIDYLRVCKALPQNELVRRNCVTALHAAGKSIPASLAGVAPAPSPRGSVLVVLANGRSAAFRQQSLYLPIIVPGYTTLATVAWPVPEYYPAPYANLSVSADGKTYEAFPLADMDAIISSEYMDRLPGMLTRIALSTAIKETATYFTNKAASHGGSLVYYSTVLATAAYKFAFNTADTRSWEMLPKEYRVAQLPLPQDGKIRIALDGRVTEATVPAGSSAAIVYVNAPSVTTTSVRVMPFK